MAEVGELIGGAVSNAFGSVGTLFSNASEGLKKIGDAVNTEAILKESKNFFSSIKLPDGIKLPENLDNLAKEVADSVKNIDFGDIDNFISNIGKSEEYKEISSKLKNQLAALKESTDSASKKALEEINKAQEELEKAKKNVIKAANDYKKDNKNKDKLKIAQKKFMLEQQEMRIILNSSSGKTKVTKNNKTKVTKNNKLLELEKRVKKLEQQINNKEMHNLVLKF